MNNKWLFIPGKYLTYYLIGTLVAFVTGPFMFQEINLIATISYSILCWLCFYIGQRSGLKIKIKESHDNILNDQNVDRILKVLCIYSVVIISLTIIDYTHAQSPIEMLKYILNPGESYFEKLMIQKEYEGRISYIGRIYTLSTGIFLLIIPLGCWFWHSIKTPTRVLILFVVLLRVIPGFATGTIVDFGFVIVELIVAIFAMIATGRVVPKVRRNLIYLMIISFFLLIAYGSYAQLNRADSQYWRPWQTGNFGTYKTDNAISNILGDRVGFALNALFAYTTHGYEGLGQCLRLEFVWTYGVGHSRALMEYIEQYSDQDIFAKHYMWRNQIATGRHPLTYWSTALTWIASDVSFFGVPIVILIIGIFFGYIWKNILKNYDPLSLVIFTRLVTLVLFLPCNNQIFQGRTMWWGSLELIILYIILRIRRKLNTQTKHM